MMRCVLLLLVGGGAGFALCATPYVGDHGGGWALFAECDALYDAMCTTSCRSCYGGAGGDVLCTALYAGGCNLWAVGSDAGIGISIDIVFITVYQC